jgi:hypothetical protein
MPIVKIIMKADGQVIEVSDLSFEQIKELVGMDVGTPLNAAAVQECVTTEKAEIAEKAERERTPECESCHEEPPIARLNGKNLCMVCLWRASKSRPVTTV